MFPDVCTIQCLLPDLELQGRQYVLVVYIRLVR